MSTDFLAATAVGAVAKLLRRLQAAGTDTSSLDVADIVAELRAIDEPQAAAVAAATEKIVDRYVSAVAATPNVSRSAIAAHTAAFVGDILTVGLARTDTAAMKAARKELVRIEAAQAANLRELESAVQSADVDTILRLRPLGEVGLPAQVDAAKVALLSAEIAAEQAGTELVSAYAVAAAAGVDEAQAKIRTIEAELADARRDHDLAGRVHRIVNEVRQQHAQEVSTLQTKLEDTAQRADRTKTARLRRLAGMDSEAPANPDREEQEEKRPPAATELINVMSGPTHGAINRTPYQPRTEIQRIAMRPVFDFERNTVDTEQGAQS